MNIISFGLVAMLSAVDLITKQHNKVVKYQLYYRMYLVRALELCAPSLSVEAAWF